MVGKAVRCKGSTNLAPRPPAPQKPDGLHHGHAAAVPLPVRRGAAGRVPQQAAQHTGGSSGANALDGSGRCAGRSSGGLSCASSARRAGEGAVQGKAAPGHLATPRFAAGYLTIDDWHSLAEEPGISLTNQRIQYATALL